MEFLTAVWHFIVSGGLSIIDFILHIDTHLISLTEQYGSWIYLILFLIIFVETGLVVMPFLPGDSLLFVVGTLASMGMLEYQYAAGLMLLAAILGDQCNYQIGRFLGNKVFGWQSSRWFNKDAFDKAHNFYSQYGGVTVFIARFMPFIRTFVPFVAGAAKMQRIKFISYNISGAIVWIIGITALGYFFGQADIVKNNFEKVIWGLIILPGLLVIGGHLLSSRKAAN